MIDLIKMSLRAGNGGNGRVAFRREKYIPKGGPSGGMGGDGGDVVIRVNPRLTTLQHLAGVSEVHAESGAHGGKDNKTGGKGDSKVIELPPGTTIWLVGENKISARRRSQYGVGWKYNKGDVRYSRFFLEKEGQMIPDHPKPDELAEDIDTSSVVPATEASLKEQQLPVVIELTAEDNDTEIVVAQGGFGGRGNLSFKSSSNTTPLEAEYGTPGEQKVVLFELKLLADVGLVGFPNVGKSTLLSKLTAAQPKVGNYPFTTLEPQLGKMGWGSGPDRREIIVADIPGLIEGAHEGKGLGYTFLRHVEHCQILLYVLALPDEVILNSDLSDTEKANELWQQLTILQGELKDFEDQLSLKKHSVIINKIDVYSNELRQEIDKVFAAHNQEVLSVSGFTGENIEQLVELLARQTG